MIKSAIARYDIREILATLTHELIDVNGNSPPVELKRLWVRFNLIELYGLNTRTIEPILPATKYYLLDVAPSARALLFRLVKPPNFDYGSAPNFECVITIRNDDLLVLHYH